MPSLDSSFDESHIYVFQSGLGVMNLVKDSNSNSYYSYHDSWNQDNYPPNNMGFEHYSDYPNWCSLSRPDFVKYMIGDCAVRMSPAISRPFYDSDIYSPYGQTYT
jgi:hypothetical protein